MILKNKNAVIYGAGGAIGSAVAIAFAKEGARVFQYHSFNFPLRALFFLSQPIQSHTS